MIEQVFLNVYKLDIPLPKNPLKALNCYIIKTNERNLVVDTGMNRDECLTAFTGGLQELNIELSKTDFFISHLHADHSGLIGRFAQAGAKVYASRTDAAIINTMGSADSRHWQDMKQFANVSGFPQAELELALSIHPGLRYGNRETVTFTYVKDGDVLTVGDFNFRCVETPGHTSGHICLYEAEKKLLVSGDHILNDITPNISVWADNYNALGIYFNSLDKVYPLDVALVLPGHRCLFSDHRRRIDELKHHHHERLNEVVSILASASYNAYEVAARMKWDLTFESWDMFPAPQKWFAVGEAIAHLKYLEDKQIVRREWRGDNYVYSLV